MNYIQSDKTANGCILCYEASQPDSEKNLIVFRGTFNFVILNRFPYTSGHLMVVPYKHKSTLEDLTPETRSEMMELASTGIHILRKIYHPQGFNLGMNIGEAGGAGITEHIHLHVVPRWNGDTNFMTSLGNTRVLPQTLEDTYKQIRREWSELDGSN